jgi:hypothetical protein
LQGIKSGDQGIYSLDQGSARWTCFTCAGCSVQAGPRQTIWTACSTPSPTRRAGRL